MYDEQFWILQTFLKPPEYLEKGLSKTYQFSCRGIFNAALTEGNNRGTDRKKTYCCIYYRDMLKTYQRGIKLF